MARDIRPVAFSPERFGRYDLLQPLGQGGMAEVFLARLHHEGKPVPVAIKRMLDVLAEDRDFVNMFRDEARIVGSLDHPNIASLFEIGRTKSTYFIAMEHVWGRDLLQLVNRYRLRNQWVPPDVVAWIARQVCYALEYAHQRRDENGNPLSIVHRDVSPQNVLLAYRGDVKLIDFGVALATARRTQTTAGTIKGKFGYMSPEQARGDNLDPRSDIFALGICMHESLAGRRLFLGRDDVETLKNVQRAPIPSISKLVPGTPLEIETIVYKSLSRDRGTRYQSAAELGEALDKFLEHHRGMRSATELGSIVQTLFNEEWREESDKFQVWFGQDEYEEPDDPTLLVEPEEVDDADAEVYFTNEAYPIPEEPSTSYTLDPSDTIGESNVRHDATDTWQQTQDSQAMSMPPPESDQPRGSWRGVLFVSLLGLVLGAAGAATYFLTRPSEIEIHGLGTDEYVRIDGDLVPADIPRARNLDAGDHEVLVGKVGGDQRDSIRLTIRTKPGQTAHVWLREKP